MDEVHHIYRTQFDLSFSSKAKNHDLQNTISELFHSEIVSDLDALLSQYSISDAYLQIPNITIDIGNIYYDDLKKDFPERVIYALKEALDKWMLTTDRAKKKQQTVYTVDYYLQAIAHFLNTGRLRWQDQSHHFNLETLWQSVMVDDASRLITMLKQMGSKLQVRQRIVYQLQEPIIQQLIRSLDPVHADKMLLYINELEAVQIKRQLVNEENKVWRKTQYLFVLTYLLVERGSIFNTKSFIRSLIKQQASHFNLAYSDLLLQLYKSAKEIYNTAIAHRFYDYIQNIFLEDFPLTKEVNQRPADDLVVSPTESEAVTQNEIVTAQLLFFLRKSYLPIRITNHMHAKLNAALLDMIKNKWDYFMAIVCQIDPDRLSKTLTLYFSNDLQVKIIQKYQGAQYDWIMALEKAIIIEQVFLPFSRIRTKHSFNTVIRQAILFTLIQFKQGVFERKNFLNEVLIYLAFQYRLNQDEFVQQALSTFSQNMEKAFYSNLGLKEFPSEVVTDFETEPSIFKTKQNRPSELGTKQLRTLQFFLLYNKLPWWADQAETKTIQTIWTYYFYKLKHPPLITFIRKHISIAALRKLVLTLVNINTLENVLTIKETQSHTQIDPAIWSITKSILTYQQDEVLKDMYLAYAFLSGHRSDETIWNQLHKIVLSNGIDLGNFYSAIMKVGLEMPSLYTHPFFALLLANLADFIPYEVAIEKMPVYPDLVVPQPKFEGQEGLAQLETEKGRLEGQRHLNIVAEIFKSYPFTISESERNLFIQGYFQDLKSAGVNLRNLYAYLIAVNLKTPNLFRSGFLKILLDHLSLFLDFKQTLEVTEALASVSNTFTTPQTEVLQNDSGSINATVLEASIQNTKGLVYLEDQPISHPPIEKSPEVSRYLQTVLDYLYTGLLPVFEKRSHTEFLMEAIQSAILDKDTKQLYLSLKNKTIQDRLFMNLSIAQKERLLSILFSSAYEFLKAYIHDFNYLITTSRLSNTSLPDANYLYHATLQYLSLQFGKTFFISDYVRHIVKNVFTDYNHLHQFISMAKLTVLQGDIKLKTPLLAILDKNRIQLKEKEIMQIENDSPDIEDQNFDQVIFIENAGLVLLWPYFSHYFATLGFIENGKFKSQSEASQAVYLLSYLVYGQDQAPEHTLVLNKLLCNLPLGNPLLQAPTFSDEMIRLSEDLLRTAIGRWEVIKNTSIDGLRTSFLMRNAKLLILEDKIELQVEHKPYDMLLDKLPYSISVIRLPWMDKLLYVKWR